MADNMHTLLGLSSEAAGALSALGVEDASQLLAVAAKPQYRAELASALGFDLAVVTKWVKRADLARVPGMTGAQMDLLALVGVDSLWELQRRNPEEFMHDRG